MAQRLYDRLKGIAYRLLPERVLVSLKRLHYQRVVANFRVEEEPDLGTVLMLVGRGDTVVDVGANIGVYTAALSRAVGAEGKVISIEPVLETANYLRHNVRTLGLSNVVVHNIAASDREARGVMRIPRAAGGIELLYMAQLVGGSAKGEERRTYRSVEVQTARLDELLLGEHVAFMKCDVEGHEAACLAGASELIERARPALLIEVSRDSGGRIGTCSALAARLGPAGYSTWKRQGDRLVMAPAATSSGNVFFLMPHHVTLLGKRGVIVGSDTTAGDGTP